MWITHSRVCVKSCIQSDIRWVESVSTRVRCPIKSGVTSGVQHTYMYQAKTISYSILLFIMSANTNLPPVIDASHTTPIRHVNRDPKLLKLIGWRHCPCFRWVPYIPGSTAQTPDAESGPTER